jgi:dCMP deaminase
MGWDRHWMDIAMVIALRSKDRSTKVGAVLIQDNRIISTGYNGFPRGIDDEQPDLHTRPTKYIWTVHAELNTFCNAAYLGVPTHKATLYSTMTPCSLCAPVIAQAGITTLVTYPLDDPRNYSNTNPVTLQEWQEQARLGTHILQTCGVNIRYLT